MAKSKSKRGHAPQPRALGQSNVSRRAKNTRQPTPGQHERDSSSDFGGGGAHRGQGPDPSLDLDEADTLRPGAGVTSSLTTTSMASNDPR